MLNIVVRGDEESRRRVLKFSRAMAPEQRFASNRRAGIAMHSDVMRTFQEQGATDGRPRWAPLKAGGRYTGTGRKRKDGSRAPKRFQTAYQLLQDTGALRNSYVPLYDQSVAGVGAASIKGHANLAPIHQNGDPSRNLPPRPMLPTERRAMEIVSQIYSLTIEQAARP